MNELPASALQPKNAGHADSHRCEFRGTSDFASTAFHLDDAGEIVGNVLGDEFDIGSLSVTVLRGSACKCRLDILPTARVRPEWVAQGHVVCHRVQVLVNSCVAVQDGTEGCVALFDRVVKVACFHPSLRELSCTGLSGGACHNTSGGQPQLDASKYADTFAGVSRLKRGTGDPVY
jgi:hypothetical protein